MGCIGKRSKQSPQKTPKNKNTKQNQKNQCASIWVVLVKVSIKSCFFVEDIIPKHIR